MRVIVDDNPLAPAFDPAVAAAQEDRARPAWIAPRQRRAAPQVLAYRLRFAWQAAASLRIHVSADERYELWLDGQRIGRGPERGSEQAWFYESYELSLAAGEHVLFARVWQLGDLAPLAQVSPAPGFLLWAEPPFDVLLSTGTAAWQVKHHAGYTFELSDTQGQGAWFVGANQSIDAATFPWGIEAGAGAGWQPTIARREDDLSYVGHVPLHMLAPATLPAPLATTRRNGALCGRRSMGHDPCRFCRAGHEPRRRGASLASYGRWRPAGCRATAHPSPGDL
jgi:alpha-L-rhamnosidase